MKFNKRKVFAVALAVCLIATLSLGTLAWFSAADEVKNDFLVAGSDDANPDKIFSVDVWEKTPESDKDTDGYEYANILPGDELKKDVYVENTGSYDQYIRIIVEISDAAAWHSAVGRDYAFENCFVGFSEDMWTHIGVNYFPVDDKIVVVAYYDGVLEPGKTLTPFSAVKIPESLTQDQAAAFEGGFSINVKAHAVQTKNVGNSAYEAFKTVAWSSLEEYK